MTDDFNDSFKGTHFYALPEGARLFEFEIKAVLGHGGFGITYLAYDEHLQEQVAIKEYLPNDIAVRASDVTVRAKSDGDRSRLELGLSSFLEEARLLARFRHRNIVHVRRFFKLNGTGYIVLDYEYGQTLDQRLRSTELNEEQLRSLLTGIISGLDIVHRRSILHRDLKPSNIILRASDDSPVLIDFGAARDFQERHSQSVTAIASAGYSPPEQYGIGGQHGPWTDIYALGGIAYRIVAGHPPIDCLRRLRKDQLVPAVEAGKNRFNQSILSTIDWMLKVDESDRPSSVDMVMDALAGRTSSQESSLREDSPNKSSSVDAPRSNRKVRIWSAIAASVFGIAIAAFFYQQLFSKFRQSDFERTEATIIQQSPIHEPQFSPLKELNAAEFNIGLLTRLKDRCGQHCASDITQAIEIRLKEAEQRDAAVKLTQEKRDKEDNAKSAAYFSDRLMRAGENPQSLQQFVNECQINPRCTFNEIALARLQEAQPKDISLKQIGIDLVDLDENRRQQYNIQRPTGVIVAAVKPGSRVENDGVRVGQLLLYINDVSFRSSEFVETYLKVLAARKSKITITFGAEAGQQLKHTINP